ncbi:hypothetical protein TorRG33x02_177120 [Trema orientale]|uniref:Uncharacterized protein n=1 Tax=Trema orientale TaxID=63057 RepID=A0A2P5ELS4_TREOI|nr:hypothetical protein TorRG33x02_177120 [Trema orientale]
MAKTCETMAGKPSLGAPLKYIVRDDMSWRSLLYLRLVVLVVR